MKSGKERNVRRQDLFLSRALGGGWGRKQSAVWVFHLHALTPLPEKKKENPRSRKVFLLMEQGKTGRRLGCTLIKREELKGCLLFMEKKP